MKIRSLEKLPKRKITMDDVLGFDDITNMLAEIDAEKHDIGELVIIRTYRDNKKIKYSANFVDCDRVNWLLDVVKCELQKSRTEEDKEAC